MNSPENFQQNDGGRAAAGFDNRDGDCLVRAIAIFSGRDYTEVRNEAVEHNARWGRQGLGSGVVRGDKFLAAQGFKAIDITPADRNDPHFTASDVAENAQDCIVRTVNPDSGAFHATAILSGTAHDMTSAPLDRLALTMFRPRN